MPKKHLYADCSGGLPPLTYTDLLARCIQIGDCQEWQGGYSTAGQPVMRRRVIGPRLEGDRGSVVNVPNAVWEDAHGRPVPAGQSVYRRCGNLRCICREHLAAGNHRTQAQAMRRLGRLTYGLHKLARLTNRRRGMANIKLGIERAREIRAQQGRLSAKQLSEQYGINPSLIYRIWRGEVWRELMPAASVFALAGTASSAGAQP